MTPASLSRILGLEDFLVLETSGLGITLPDVLEEERTQGLGI